MYQYGCFEVFYFKSTVGLTNWMLFDVKCVEHCCKILNAINTCNNLDTYMYVLLSWSYYDFAVIVK